MFGKLAFVGCDSTFQTYMYGNIILFMINIVLNGYLTQNVSMNDSFKVLSKQQIVLSNGKKTAKYSIFF